MGLAVSPIVSLLASAQTAAQIAQDGFRMTLAADSPGLCIIEATSDCSTWQTIQTINYTSGQVQLLDVDARLLSHRFYRARSGTAIISMGLGKNR